MNLIIGLVLFITLTQIVFLGTVIFLENRDPAKTMIWLVILGVLPLFGALFYFIFGRPYKKYGVAKHKRVSLEQLAKLRQYSPEFFLTENFSGDAPFPFKEKFFSKYGRFCPYS